VTTSSDNQVRISVPASCANLVPGYGALALAIDLRLTATVEWPDEQVRLHDFDDPLHWWRDAVESHARYAGTLQDFQQQHAWRPNLLASAFVKAVLRAGPDYHLPARLDCALQSDIPVGLGLGSSAAAVVAGSALAEVWRTGDADRGAVFEDASEIEGRADNAAAATYGGLQAALTVDGNPRAAGVKIHESIRCVLCVPDAPLKSGNESALLPETVRPADAAANQRALLTLLFGLRTGEEAAIRSGLQDRIFVPHRKGTIPGYDEVVLSAMQSGAFGATISGAGGAVIALGTGDMSATGAAMRDAFSRNGIDATVLTPAIDTRGLLIDTPADEQKVD
jgi:homoserine kinase